MGERIINIYLTDFGHTYFSISPATIPIGIAYISAVLRDRFKNKVNVKLFKYPEKFISSLNEKKPDIIGMGLYNWNENLSVELAKIAREKYRDVLLVAGGLNIPGVIEEIQRRYINRYDSLFDIYVPYEGERPMTQIVERVLDVQDKKDVVTNPISGCFVYNGRELTEGTPMPMYVDDLSEIPSPYLTGIVDEFLDDSLLAPVIQSMRGCPYSCSFCVGGNKVCSKIRLFSMERIIDEILYLKQRAKNHMLRITDENFGLLKRDVEIAKSIENLYHKDGYPEALKLYTNKTTDDIVKKIMLSLREFIPYNISLQTTTPAALREINRRNPPLDKIAEAFRWAKKNKIATATELIHGFPGETYESYMECVNNLYKIKVDSGDSHEAWLLPNTKLASRDSVEKHGIVTRFVLGDDAMSMVNGKLICEYDEHLVGTKYQSVNEHYKLCEIDAFVKLTLYLGYFRELTYHAMNYGIKPTDIYKEIARHNEKYPILNNVFSTYKEKVIRSHHKTKEDVYNYVKSIVDRNESFPPTRFIFIIVGGFIFSNDFEGGIDEYIKAIIKLFSSQGSSEREFIDVCRELKKFALNMVINPLKLIEDSISFKSHYNFSDWISGSYEKKLINYYHDKEVTIHLSLPNPVFLRNLYERGEKLKTKSERVQLFFRHTTSACLRRILSCKFEDDSNEDIVKISTPM